MAVSDDFEDEDFDEGGVEVEDDGDLGLDDVDTELDAIEEARQAKRERDGASEVIEALAAENERLKKENVARSVMQIKAAKEAAEKEVENLKSEIQEAVEMGDGEATANLTQKLTQATLQLAAATDLEGRLAAQAQGQGQEAPAKPNPHRDRWFQRNASWFQKDKEMTQLAFAINERLINEGKNDSLASFYETLDREVRKRFPERFGKPSGAAARTANFSGGSSMNANGKRTTRVVLTPREAAVARRLGVDPVSYAREKAKIERLNG